MDRPPSAAEPHLRWRELWRSLRGGPGHEGPPSDHFDGERFFNPAATTGRTLGDLLRWQRTRRRVAWPAQVVNRARPELPATLAPGALALTFVNHITFLVQLDGVNLLTDPVYSERASPFRRLGPRRVRAPGLAFEALPPVHVVLISHNHYDHLDIVTLRRLQSQHAPCFVTTLGNGPFLREFGLRRVEELDWWEHCELGHCRVELTPAQHWSARGPRNRNRTLWGGFIVQAAGRRVFFAGDTGYGPHFAELRARSGPIDLALLPIGAYEPRWFMCDQHMNPEDAVRAHVDLGAPLSVGTHFGCFQLTDEGIDDPPRELGRALAERGLSDQRFIVLETGETRRFAPQEFATRTPAASGDRL
jgi:L-ascorbate metabolism protein UlaG (beta-lactamase superfamily)